MIDLKKEREKKGITQEELAEEVGVARTTITMIENASNKPSVPIAKKIAEILELNWSDFYE